MKEPNIIKKVLGDQFTEGITTKPSIAKFMPIRKNDSRKKIGIFRTDKGSYTNTHWMLKPKYFSEALKKRSKPVGGFNSREVYEAYLWPEETELERLEYAFSYGFSDFDYKIAVYETMDDLPGFNASYGKLVGFNEDYIAYLEKHIKDFSLKINHERNIAVIFSGAEKAGMIMPIITTELTTINDLSHEQALSKY